ncbi:MAG: envelope biogenesis factor ElyC [Deltaproteobacteria bacterium]|nr:envelope biogenesis factor ElyC [Deltaproteobacteria bacterium]
MFLFKKTVSPFFMPLPFSLLVSFTGLYLLWMTSKKKAGKILVTAGILFTAIFSFTPFADFLIKPLEKQYSPYHSQRKDNIKYVVVLGGGHIYDISVPASSRISYPAMMRLAEGIKIFNEIPGSKLLLSGGGSKSPDTDAEIMFTIARSLGVKKERIIIESKSKDTKDQARIIRNMVKNAPFVLVTSAAHMKRSVALFNKMGMKPITAPTDYLARDDGRPKGFGYLVPSSNAVARVESAVHEYLGIIWAKLRGQV